MLDRQLMDLPVEILQQIAWLLSMEEVKIFSSASTSVHAILDLSFFSRRVDFQEKMHGYILDAVTKAIADYLLHDKSHPGYVIPFVKKDVEFLTALGMSISSTLMLFPALPQAPEVRVLHIQETEKVKKVRYDRGFHRAHCLRHITSNPAIPIELSLFAIHAFLHERNGFQLKKRIRTALTQKTNGKKLASNYLDNYVVARFGARVQEMSAALLNEVHTNSFDEYVPYDSYQFQKKHSWKEFLEGLQHPIASHGVINAT